MGASPLLRPSELARFWNLHPKTVYLWIRDGRLAAVRTPGDQFRVRASDVRAFCHASKMTLPPFITPLVRRVQVIGAPSASKAVRAAMKTGNVTFVTHASPLEGLLVAAISPPSLLVIDAATASFAVLDAVRALRRSTATEKTPLLVFNIATAAKADAIARAGASSAIVREKGLQERIAEALGLGP